MFIRRDSPIVFNVVSALDFYDESTDISNHNSGMYNCETSAITVYVTLVNQNKLSGNMDFALQAQMTKGNDCTLPNERARNALLADQSRNTYASVMAPKNRTFTLNQQQVVWQKVTVFYDANLDTYAELWAESDSKSVIIAFRGSKKGSELNLKSDLSFEKVPCTLGGFTSGCGRIHEGFLKSYMSLAPQIIQYYKSNFIGYTIQLTGHSLGAAMATLAAFDMSYILLNTSISLSNFGSPSVGDLSFYAFFQAMIVKTNMIVYRFVHRQLTDSELVIQLDPIATIADNVGYYHVVIPVYLESSTSFSVAQGSKLHSVAGYTNNLIAFSTGYTSTPIENATSSGQSISWRSLMSLLVVLMMFI